MPYIDAYMSSYMRPYINMHGHMHACLVQKHEHGNTCAYLRTCLRTNTYIYAHISKSPSLYSYVCNDASTGIYIHELIYVLIDVCEYSDCADIYMLLRLHCFDLGSGLFVPKPSGACPKSHTLRAACLVNTPQQERWASRSSPWHWRLRQRRFWRRMGPTIRRWKRRCCRRWSSSRGRRRS